MSNLTFVNNCELVPEDDIFSFLPPVDLFDIKKDQIAAEMAALMVLSRKNRTELASELGCKKSYLSGMLSGKRNLTIKTIWEFASKLDYEFDVVFRKCDTPRPSQPWTSKIFSPDAKERPIPYIIRIQTDKEVESDLLEGKGKSVYFSLSISHDVIPVKMGIKNNKALSFWPSLKIEPNSVDASTFVKWIRN